MGEFQLNSYYSWRYPYSWRCKPRSCSLTYLEVLNWYQESWFLGGAVLGGAAALHWWEINEVGHAACFAWRRLPIPGYLLLYQPVPTNFAHQYYYTTFLKTSFCACKYTIKLRFSCFINPCPRILPGPTILLYYYSGTTITFKTVQHHSLHANTP